MPNLIKIGLKIQKYAKMAKTDQNWPKIARNDKKLGLLKHHNNNAFPCGLKLILTEVQSIKFRFINCSA